MLSHFTIDGQLTAIDVYIIFHVIYRVIVR